MLQTVTGFSEITKSIIVKHMQHVGLIRAFCLPRGGLAKFFSAWRTEKIAGLWFARGDQYLG